MMAMTNTLEIDFAALPAIVDHAMGGQFYSSPRKKTVLNGRTCLVKLGPKTLIQLRADALKPVFDLPRMFVEPVFDVGSKQPGCAIPWFENSLGQLSKLPEVQWSTSDNLVTLIKTVTFDGVISNSDRMLSNLLLLSDGSVLPIDEGDAERPVAKWVLFRRSTRAMMALALKKEDWFQRWIRHVEGRTRVNGQWVGPAAEMSPFVKMRLMDLRKIADETVRQICR